MSQGQIEIEFYSENVLAKSSANIPRGKSTLKIVLLALQNIYIDFLRF